MWVGLGGKVGDSEAGWEEGEQQSGMGVVGGREGRICDLFMPAPTMQFYTSIIWLT